MSWQARAFASGPGYELLANRDESRRRPRAVPPRRLFLDGVRCLAPLDPEGGGTWITVNEHGVTLCLLNLYQAPGGDRLDQAPAAGPNPVAAEPPHYHSRGQLVLDLAGAASAEEALARLAELDLAIYRPFTLVALDPLPPPANRAGSPVRRWNGTRLSGRPVAPPPLLTSSGHDAAGVALVRRRLWQEAATGEGLGSRRLLALHRSHLPERGPYSPCMHREDAVSVSLTWVRVTPRAVYLAYTDGPPCRTPFSARLRLPRAGSSGRRRSLVSCDGVTGCC